MEAHRLSLCTRPRCTRRPRGRRIRAGKPDPVFAGGNEYLKRDFPKLDYILKVTIER